MDSLFLAKQDFTTQELQLLWSEMEKRKKSTSLSWLLWLLFGGLGGHRFYLGFTPTAIVMVCLFLFVGVYTFFIPTIIWLLIDLLMLAHMIRYTNDEIEESIIDEINLLRTAKENDRQAGLLPVDENTLFNSK